MNNETIAAVATARGIAGIGTIRISGDNAISTADKVFRCINGKSLSTAKGYTAHYGHVYNAQEEIDEAIALVFRSPLSYTGEDVVEISCHGGLYTTEQTLEAVLDNGARLADKGEFTKRAYLNGKLSLTQAESVIDIIKANGYQTAKAALASHEGKLDEQIGNICKKITTIAAHLNAWADYPEEEIEEISIQTLIKELVEIKDELKSMLDRFNYGKILREGISVAIVGKPNVGKSTLMNQLSGYEKSIVTKIPGTTRDVIEENVVLDDIVLKLSDTAGIHAASDEVEKIGVDKAYKQIKQSELVLAIFDTSENFKEEDKKIIDTLDKTKTIGIINKTDLNSLFEDNNYIEEHTAKVVKMSAKNGVGIDNLKEAISEVTKLNKLDPSENIFFNERQKEAAKKAYTSLIEAIEIISDGVTLDAVTVLIEDALSYLLELSGKRVSETVVENVFSQFCVGK